MVSQADIYSVVQPLLHPSEVIKVAVRIQAPASAGKAQDASKVLALIANVESGIEEGALLSVLDRQTPSVEGAVPIYADFEVAFEQVETNTTASLENAGQPVQACFRAKFLADGGRFSISAITADLSILEDILKETRRLTEIAEKQDFSSSSASHRWLTPYIDTSRARSMSSGSTNTQATGVSTWLQYGNKAIEGLPALASTFGSFGFFAAGASPPAAQTRSLPGSWASPHLAGDHAPRPNAAKRYRTKRAQDAEMHRRLAGRQSEFVKPQRVKLHVCTFNCSGQFYDPSIDLIRWIRPEEDPDLVVVGLQEMDLRPEVLMVRHDPSIREAWANAIARCLNKPKHADDDTIRKYRLVESKQLAGLCVMLFSKVELLEAGTVDEVSTTSVMTGWAGFAGNKGACCVRLKVYDSYIALLCAHLAAFQEMADRRNADFQEITKRAVFSNSAGGTTPGSPNGQAPPSSYSTALDADLCIFFGDLNYRLDQLSIHEIREQIASKSWSSLRKHDQLKTAQKSGKAFCGFEESKLDFQPSYKFDKGTDKYDSSEKERKPAWTDRILWKVNEDLVEYLEDGQRTAQLKVTCEEYASVMDIRLSDHKPVLARLGIEIDVVDEVAFDRVLKELEPEVGQC